MHLVVNRLFVQWYRFAFAVWRWQSWQLFNTFRLCCVLPDCLSSFITLRSDYNYICKSRLNTHRTKTVCSQTHWTIPGSGPCIAFDEKQFNKMCYNIDTRDIIQLTDNTAAAFPNDTWRWLPGSPAPSICWVQHRSVVLFSIDNQTKRFRYFSCEWHNDNACGTFLTFKQVCGFRTRRQQRAASFRRTNDTNTLHNLALGCHEIVARTDEHKTGEQQQRSTNTKSTKHRMCACFGKHFPNACVTA